MSNGRFTMATTRRRSAGLLAAAAFAVTVLATPATAASTSLVIATDPFIQSTCAASTLTNHHANVEPDTFSNGSTIVAAYQVGRIYDGGACAIGYATSTNNGGTWTSGLLPGLTKYVGRGTFDRATDAAVAYDAKHNAWLVSSLVLTETGGAHGAGILTSRSTDGGLTWGNPVVTNDTSSDPDKNWIVCDNTSTSGHYGNCYTEWDDFGAGNRMEMSTSTDGGLTWGAPKTNNSGIIGGQPVVGPDGTVIVPTANASETAIGAFSSIDGGVSWSTLTTIATVKHHKVGGNLREGPLPSAEIDGNGIVYVTWADCRFERSCKANDLVLAHATDTTGTNWSAVTRIPLDPTGSGVDHFLPGLAVNKATGGSTAQLGLTYYFYPKKSSALSVGFASSADGGGTWSASGTVTGGMISTWAASTSQGRMVGDYISTSFGSDNRAHGVYGAAHAPTTGPSSACSLKAVDNCDAPIETFTSDVVGGSLTGAKDQVLFAGTGGTAAQSSWNIVDNNGSKHRD